MSRVDRVATQEDWVALADSQEQAYDCGNEGTSERELTANVLVESESGLSAMIL